MKLKPSKRFFILALAACAVIFVGFFAVREAIGPFLPQVIDENFYTGFIVVVMGLFLWNRQVRNEEGKAAALDPGKEDSGGAPGEIGEAGEARGDGDRKDGDAGN